MQDSAYPYHDWNERITAECYGPNLAARILDDKRRIEQIVNNYSSISFNFGPTLLSWAAANAPEAYGAILEADRSSQLKFSGHGSAMSQAYNHIIMPLANRRDKVTQVTWGIADFRHRFGRMPEGMWLPETAVDLETLDILAEQGIKFTVLAPHQAKRFRDLGDSKAKVEGAWTDVTGAKIDPTRSYKLKLASGRSLDLFFYDGPISRAVAFEHLLDNGERFAQRLVGAFSDTRAWEQIMHIATDGETYGHHHRYGEMALAYALHHIESKKLAKLTNYAEYLEKAPPRQEVEIYENTSWSCVHGVERWRSNCGCNSGGHAWNQEWRAPLRDALDWLRDCVAPLFEESAAQYVKDIWAARNAYIEVVLDRRPECREAFKTRHTFQPLTQPEEVRLWKLLELQRHAMLMYTSCGWFFDELSGIETVQVIQYAARVVQLAQELFGDSLEAQFLDKLRLAKSNLPQRGDGADIYNKLVKPTVVDLRKLAAHYAISSLFEVYPEHATIYCYSCHRQDYKNLAAGKMRLVLGRGRFTSEITQESDDLTFCVLHFGDHNIHAGVRPVRAIENYRDFLAEVGGAFSRADIPEVIRLMDKYFGGNTYSLKSLFKDEQRKILDEVLNSTIAEAESAYRQLYEHHAPLMRFLTDINMPLPKAFQNTAEFALNGMLRRAVGKDSLDPEKIKSFVEQAQSAGVTLDSTTLEFTFRRAIERLTAKFMANTSDFELLQRLADAVVLQASLPFPVVLWSVQNRCYEVLRTVYPDLKAKAEAGDEASVKWVAEFCRLGEKLGFRM